MTRIAGWVLIIFGVVFLGTALFKHYDKWYETVLEYLAATGSIYSGFWLLTHPADKAS